ncbi:AraC family transcriptional regulator [Fibrivirga algicola]|uniref:Helix-turn-helix transcriptional regulator n=1 Tax=Fibrivirga algicola TaxID=2950420 RepID=A0ABX0QIS0_9BACT|nr:AraC family transcriptional regulator [Fibrivirga algicola]ARK12514.1 transcriptional regulator [Fibrella sp. ES10-3-2-2]NID12340.1 helix-turn-helix transcriptional regulator [Fibrivirga algicola]
MTTIYREITPLTQSDCFTLFHRTDKVFDFPLHNHDEYELNFLANTKGAKRIMGDHTALTDDLDLVLVGSNLPHGWFDPARTCQGVREVTIQFHRTLFDEKFLKRNQLSFIRALLERSAKGILFTQETAAAIRPRLEALTQKNGFDSVLELMSILHDLSTSRNMRTLSNTTFTNEQINYNSRRIEKAFTFMHESYDKEISLADVAKLVNMSEVSFSRFIKKRTGKTFIESLNEIRLGQASRLLIDTTNTITEVAYKCGFNNISYFNRVFRSKNGCTPREFRQNYSGTRVFI